MPPAVAVANETTSTPKRSSRCLTPAVAPLRANTNVPTSSSTSTVPVAYSLNPASVSRTCSAPNAGIVPGYGLSKEPEGHGGQDHADDEVVVTRDDPWTVAGITAPDMPTRRPPGPGCPWTASARDPARRTPED